MCYRLFIVVAAILTLGPLGEAQQTAAKIAIVNVQQVLLGTKSGKKDSQELTAKFESKQKEFQGRQSEITKLEDQLRNGTNLMSQEKKVELDREINDKKKQLQRDAQDAEEALQNEQQKLLGSLGQRVIAVIEKYAKDHGYAIVLDISSPNTPVLYAATALDISQEVIPLCDEALASSAAVPSVRVRSGR